MKLPAEGCGVRIVSAAARCGWFGDKLSPAGSRISAACRAAALAADANSCRRAHLPGSVRGVASLGKLWAQSAGITLAFAVFASAMLGSAPVWSQSMSTPVLTFVAATTDTTVEGGDDVELHITVPPSHVSSRVEMVLTGSGTAVRGTDYSLIAADPAQGIVLGGGENSTITLVVDSTPAEPLRLLLRPRADDPISQGDRFLNLRISRYRVVPEGGETVVLPAALDFTIRDDGPLTVQQVQVGFNRDFACIVLNGGTVRCVGDNSDGRSTPPTNLGPVTQLGVGRDHSCALTVSGEVRCWGSNSWGRATPPGLGPVAQLAVGGSHSCAVTVSGQVRCWGYDEDGEATPPDNLGPVAQLAVNTGHSCALTISGQVRCWGRNNHGQTTPPAFLGSVAQIAVGDIHSCALTVSGEVRCWGHNGFGQSLPPENLGPVSQLAAGWYHSCALADSGQVRCWGDNDDGRATPPGGLGSVAQLMLGRSHSCVRTVSGRMVCWGNVVDISSLPAGMVTAVDKASGRCALLAEGSVYCPRNPELVPPGLGAGDVAMSVWPRQLQPGQRAAIRFANLRDITKVFTARIEVFGEGTADIGSDYRLLDSNGQPLPAEPDGSYLLGGGDPRYLEGIPQLAGNSLEALVDGRSSRLYVRPLELLSVSGQAPSIRKVAQPIELGDRGNDGLFFTASIYTVTEGAEEVQLSIWLPLAHSGLRVELELAVSGTALAGSDYTLVAADSAPRIVLGAGENSTITLQVDSVPTEPLRLLLRPRGDDRISQGDRFLNLQISRYRVVPEVGRTVALPPALDFTIRDNEPPTVQQIQVQQNGDFACIVLNGGAVRCAGANDRGQATPPEDLDRVVQLSVGIQHSCALTVLGQLRCWGRNQDGRSSPPVGHGPFDQLAVGWYHSCARTVSGQLRCWGDDSFGQATPPEDYLGPFARLAVGDFHSCAVAVSGRVHCWGRNNHGQTTPPNDLGPVAQLGLGSSHSCAVTVSGEVRCWGLNSFRENTPPDDLGPFAQLVVSRGHSCVLTVAGQVHCWGYDGSGETTPPNDLGPVTQLGVGMDHSCALTVLGELRCWGGVAEILSLPAGLVTAVSEPVGLCALLAEGSVYCPGRPDLVPPGLGTGDVVMSVWPRQLETGQRAAIRFIDLRETTGVFTVRIEVFGEGDTDISSYYRLLDSSGRSLPLEAEPDGSYRLEGDPNSPNSPQLAGNSLEALAAGRGSRLYVRPLELLSASGPVPSIRAVAQLIELSTGPFFTASIDTLAEGAEEAQLSILLPLAHTGLRVELELTVSGTALAGSDYTLFAADSVPVIVLGGRENSTITLRVESAPTEPLRLRLRPRAADRINQGDRFLNLRISRYRVIPEVGGTVDLPAALDFTIRDDELQTVQQVQVGTDRDFACVLLNGGSVRCRGNDRHGQSSPPADLGVVVQIGVGRNHSCAVTVSGGRVRCWGSNGLGKAMPPKDLGPVAQLAVGESHSCALTVSGEARCWGNDGSGQSTPPDDLGPAVQLGVGSFYSCALTVSGRVRCWGSIHSVGTPPNDLGPVVQLGVGDRHSCALTVSGRVRCWGDNRKGQATPPDDLGPVAQLSLGFSHSCALTVSGQVRCWGGAVAVSSLPPGLVVTAIDASGTCVLLPEGSVYCPDNPELVPPGLGAGDVVMSVWPRQLESGQRAAIRFTDLRETTAAFTARIEVFGEGDTQISSDYRLLGHNGMQLVAGADGSYLIEGGIPPMAWLEASGTGRSSRLYIRPLELLSVSEPSPSIRRVAQPIGLTPGLTPGPAPGPTPGPVPGPVPGSTPGLSFTASTDTVTEGGEAVQLSIMLPGAHAGSMVELELAVGGTAMEGLDYTLAAADPEQGIVLGGEANSTVTLVMEFVPAEPLRLRLRPRAADSISQGDRFLNLRISRYRVAPEIGETVALPPALNLIIRDDEPPTVQQVQVRGNGLFACVLSNGGSVRCAGANDYGRATPPGDDLGPFAELAVGHRHSCALTVLGEVRCWGFDGNGESSPPADLGPVAQLGAGIFHSCALTVSGGVHCWGRSREASPPMGLGPVAQLAVGLSHSCALTVSGQLGCWGRNDFGQSSPPDDLGPVVQIGVGSFHSCALTVSGQVGCWGFNAFGRSSPPTDLGAVAQLAVGNEHSCALTVSGQVHCWGSNADDRSTPPADLGPVAELSVGFSHSCALTVSGRVRCWGAAVDISSLPTGLVTAVSEPVGHCALLAEGSVYCPDNPELVPPGLGAGDVVMSVWPRQLESGQRAAIRFTDLRETTAAFTARIKVFGEGDTQISSDYRLLDRNGMPLVAGADGSYLIEGGIPPMAWLEASGTGRSSRLYIRPLELLSVSEPSPSIRRVAQPIGLTPGLTPGPTPGSTPGLSFTASTDTVTEGGEAVQLSIMLPGAHAGSMVELELAVSGTAMEGLDYTLAAADPEQGIVLGGEANSMITLRVNSAPAEPLHLLLRPRGDDRISQGDRFLNLRISRYRVVSEGGGIAALPPALDFTIRDDEPLTVQQIQVGGFRDFACVILNGGSVRCEGDNEDGQATPPDDLGPVVQLGLGSLHSCALTVSGQVRCWGANGELYHFGELKDGRSTPPDDLGPVAQLSVGGFHSCAVTVLGEVRCWGSNGGVLVRTQDVYEDGRSTPPGDLGPVVQLGLGSSHSCAVTVLGEVRCWGSNGDLDFYGELLEDGRSTPPGDLGPVAQLSVGSSHSCAVTVSGRVRCWGSDEDGRSTPPDDLGPVVQLGLGSSHSCALTVSGRVRCWGYDLFGRSTPPEDLGPVAQLSVGKDHSCAVTVSGQLRCWGDFIDISSLPPGSVTAIDASGLCALLTDGSVYCPGRQELIPPELRSDVAMSVWPRQLRPGERAAIRFADLREMTGAFTVRIEVFGEVTANVSSYYRLLDSSGRPLEAEDDANFPLVAGNSGNSVLLTGNPPMAWLEASGDDRSSRLYVRPLELLPASGPAPTIRRLAQPVELIDGLFLAAPIDTVVTEGAEEVPLSIWLPLAHTGLPVELELAVIGTALAGSDYTLVAADSEQGIVLGGGENSTITLVVDSTPAEPLRLLLRPRADDRISQGVRFLNLRISRYRVVSEGGGTAALPPALDFTIRDDEPPTVQQIQVGTDEDFACVLLNDGSVRCAGDNEDGRATPPDDLGPVVQIGLGDYHSCALMVSREVRCWGFNDDGSGDRRATPPDDLGPVAQISVGRSHSCALTVSGGVRCWGFDGDRRATPPDDLGPVAQISVGRSHSCALTVSGGVRCWGWDFLGRISPPGDHLGPFVQLAVGSSHSCALTVSGRVRCWGNDEDDRSTPPDDLGPVVQLGLGSSHSCALTVSGRVRCWGYDLFGRSTPPEDLGPVAQLSVGKDHSCAVTVSGQLRCWGDFIDVSSLPPGLVTAIDASGLCALLAEGSVYCSGRQELIPPELSPGDVVMSVWSRQLLPGERAAIRFADLREATGAFAARIEVFGEGEADVSSDYRLLDSNGQPLAAEDDANSPLANFPLVAGNSGNSVLLTGNPPMAWLEASGDDRSSRLYVRPLELLSASGPAPTIRKVAQPIELIDGLFLTASTNTVTEGAEGAQLSIFMPLAHTGLQVEMELAVTGTTLAGSDYTLVAADSEQGIVLGGGENSTITLLVDSAPAEPLHLLLRPRGDDRISQGIRFLNLRISSYRVVSEGGGTAALPPALDFTIRDDEPPTVQQIQVGTDEDFACVLLNDGSVRCAGDNEDGRATPPDDLGPVVQIGLGDYHSCALMVSREVRCWGFNDDGSGDRRATPPDDLGPVAQISVGRSHSCALTVSGGVRCWGFDGNGRTTPPGDLGLVAQIGLGDYHSCALTVLGGVRCWGVGADGSGDRRATPPGDLGPVAQLAVGEDHTCALTVSGGVRCWGSNRDGRFTLPDDLGPVAQIGVGDFHSCALTVSGGVRCWGFDGNGRSTPPSDLGPVAQLSVGDDRSCALTVSGRLRCWGDFIDISSLPPGSVKAIDASGLCALLAEGSAYCPDNPDLVPPELSAGDVVMSVWPRQLRPGERAAIRFADLREATGAFTARIEVFGEGEADVGSYYRLLDSSGRPLEAEEDGSYLLGGDPNSPQLAGNSLEALADGRGSRLYVRPLELLSASGPAPSTRLVAQPVELSAGPFLTASTNTVTEGAEEVQLSILLPLTHIGLRVEMELAVIGTALAGSDYTLIAADSEQGIVLGGGENSTITLVVDSVPAEPLRLLLRPRADDRINQGVRFLNLRISSYRVGSEGGGTAALPPALDFTIRDDEPPTVQQIQVGTDEDFACVLLNGGSVRCGGDNTDGRATPPADLGPVAQIGVGEDHSCALTVLGEVRCWGSNGSGRATPPDDLGPVAQLTVGRTHSCAVTGSGEVRCWGPNDPPDSRSTPPDGLGTVAQVSVGWFHTCALTVLGGVRCWGNDDLGQSSPPNDLGPVAQIGVNVFHSCALTVSGEVRCWGLNDDGSGDRRATPPVDLGSVAQIGVGRFHTCALTVLGGVRCWGSNSSGKSTPPNDLSPVVQLMVGANHSCALTILGQLRCWGDFIDISSLPPGSVTAIDASGSCALLAEGSAYCPDNPDLVPPELSAGEVVMSVWPRQLRPGERAAIRFADLREATGAFTARIEVFGEGEADVGSYYRLLDSSGRPLEAEEDANFPLANFPLVAGNSGNSVLLTGNPPMAWLEALADGRGSLLYVRLLELLPASVLAPSIRMVVQPVELSAGPFLTASADTVTEGAEEAQLSVLLPLAHTGLRVEIELAASGTALAGLDYTLVAADPERVIVLGGEITDEITLRVDSAPTELRLLLRPRADDPISQGIRFLNLRISSYRVVSEGGGTAALPPALDFTIRDDEPPTVQQIQVGTDKNFACVLLNDGSVRCAGSNGEPPNGRATPPEDLGPVAQIGVGEDHSCALMVLGEVRCWGDDTAGRATPPEDLEPVAQLSVGKEYSCAVTVSGRVRCWGRDRAGRAMPPGNLEPVAQVGVGDFHSCGLMVSGEVRCWGFEGQDRTTPPEDLEPVAQLSVGGKHGCALTVSGEVHCWGTNDGGRSMPPDDLGRVAQLSVGNDHSCALTVLGEVRCWGAVVAVSSLPAGLVTAINASGLCALLADGSVYCPTRPQFAPPELGPGDVVMSVWPRQLLPGQRAAIRFADLRETAGAFTARIEVFGDGSAEIGRYYRLLDRDGQPLVAEDDGSYRLEGDFPPMAWLEALADGRGSLLYVRLLELLPASVLAPSIRMVAQPVELSAGPFLTASADTVTEGAGEAQLSVLLPLAHTGLRVEIELAASGTALAGLDYTLVAADPERVIVLGGEITDEITLRVGSAPTGPLRLLLRPRADDRISQGDRSLSLRISRYRVIPEIGGTTDLSPALDLAILDDEPPTAQQLQMGGVSFDDDFACVLNGGSVRCWGDVTELVRPPDDLGTVVQLAVGRTHSCALTASGEVRCWGSNSSGQSTPPGDLGLVAQLALGESHSCALTVSGQVRCWGDDLFGQSTPPVGLVFAQISVGDRHSCALTVSGQVRCWGRDTDGEAMPPRDLGLVMQLTAGYLHSCAVTKSGSQVRCWGRDDFGETTPPDDLGPVAQLAMGRFHSCAVTVSGQVRCWGSLRQLSVPSLPPGEVKEIAAGWDSSCALLTAGSVRCWGGSLDRDVPEGLRPGDIVMSVSPQQLQPLQRAAIRFADLREMTGAFTVRIEVFGEGEADVSSYYRLLDSNGQPLSAEPDGSYLVGGGSPQLAGNSLEALVGGQGQPLNLYVRALDIVPAAGPVPSLRRAAQRVEIRNPEPFAGKLILQMHGGAKQLLLPTDVAPIPLRLLLVDSDDRPLSEPTVLTVQLQGMVTGDGAVVPSGPFEITASDTVAGTADILVILGTSGETTLRLSVSDLVTGAVADLAPTVLRVTRLSELLDLDVTEDERLGTEDVISLIRLVSAGRDDPLSLGAAQQARLKSLIPDDVVDLRLDLDGNGRMEAADFRILLRYLAGLRDSALGEGVRQQQVEELFQQDQ